MKTFTPIRAALLALASVGIASAQVNIKITGSTAYRKADYFGIVNSLNNPQIATTATAGGDMSGASQAVIIGTGKSGTTYAGQTVTVQVAFAGSVGGINSVVNALTTIPAGTTSAFTANATWLSASNVTSATPVATVNEGAGTITGFTTVAANSGTCDAPAAPQATFSDSFQSSSPFPTPALLDENPSAQGIGVVEFFWVKSNASGVAGFSDLTNITSNAANLLLANGELPLSLFTGNASDAGTDLLLVGRNNDSGTRLDTEAEADSSSGAYGFGQTLESQEQPVFNTGSTQVTTTTFVGNNGYPSGSNVAKALDTPQASGATDDAGDPFIFVGYVGQSDKNTAITGGNATVLTYNGVAESTAAVENGQYTFWSYEHLYYKSGISAAAAGFLNTVGNQVRLTDYAQSGIPLSGMLVARNVEGGVIAPN